MVAPEDIVDFASDFAGYGVRCSQDGDLLARMNLGGAEARAFIEAFAQNYGVDAASVKGHFHYGPWGSSFWRRERPVGPDGRVFAMIPITPRLLAEAANAGRWVLEYPTHRVQVSRWPLVVMFILLATLVLAVTVLSAKAAM